MPASRRLGGDKIGPDFFCRASHISAQSTVCSQCATHPKTFIKALPMPQQPWWSVYAQVTACVAGMFDLKEFGAFKHHLRDFLVQVSGLIHAVTVHV